MKGKLLFIIPLVPVFCLCLIISEKACNYAFSGNPEKPFPFNHKLHLSKTGMLCTVCHRYYENGRFAGIPEAGICRDCHEKPLPGENTADAASRKIKIKELAKYGRNEKPWGSHSMQPGYVYFSHKAVMDNDKMKCETCHGLKAESTGMEKIRGRISMAECEECHRTLGLSNKCAVCHD